MESSPTANAIATYSFNFIRLAADAAIKTGKKWKTPPRSVSKIMYVGLSLETNPVNEMIAMIPAIIPAASKTSIIEVMVSDIMTKIDEAIPRTPLAFGFSISSPSGFNPNISMNSLYTSVTCVPTII